MPRAAKPGVSGRSFAVVPIPRKGLGIVATRKIARGERILAERPAFMLSPMEVEGAAAKRPHALEVLIRDRVAELTDSEMDQFWELPDCHVTQVGSGKTAFGIWQTNAIATASEGGYNGLYLLGSRFNHSCTPNVNRCWIESLGVEVFHASRDIPPRTELCVYYIDPKSLHAERQARLLADFNFRCECEACSLTGKALETSETLRREYQELDALVPQLAENDPNGALDLVEAILAIIEAEFESDPHMSQRAYYDGFQLAITAGNMELAKAMMQNACAARLHAEGEHTETEAFQRYAADIFCHPLLNGSDSSNSKSSFESDWLRCKPCAVQVCEDETATPSQSSKAVIDLSTLD